MRFVTLTRMSLLLLLVVGCNSKSPDDFTAKSGDGEEAASVEASAADVATTTTQEVQVDIRNWVEIQQWVSKQRGKVVVIDVWSTW